MKNAKKPINPIPFERMENYGLTKREYFAGLAMEGILLNPNLCTLQCEKIAEDAIRLADELLNQLEK